MTLSLAEGGADAMMGRQTRAALAEEAALARAACG
jgi:hypothetical protein